MKNKFFIKETDKFSGETFRRLTEEGHRELMRLEKTIFPYLSSVIRKKILSYSDVDILEYLIRKEREREKKETTTKVVKRTTFTDHLLTYPEINWFMYDYDQIEKIDHYLRKQLEDCEAIKELILEDYMQQPNVSLIEHSSSSVT